MGNLTKPEARQMHRLGSLMDALREIDGELTLNQIAVFVAAAGDEGVTLSDISEKLDLSLSTVSRAVASLSDYKVRGKPGKGLLRQVYDVMDRRVRRLELTPDGVVKARSLGAIMDKAA